MRTFAAAFLACAVMLACHPVSAAQVRISQVYIGGGWDSDPGSKFDTDYVELFNAGGTAVDLGGWVLAYDHYNKLVTTPPPFTCTGCVGAIPAGTMIQPCSYLLITLGVASTEGNPPLPVPADLNLDTPGGSVSQFLPGALLLMSGGIPNGTCGGGPTGQDLVGWNSTTRCAQGTPLPAFSGAGALVRKQGGMTYSGDNTADFDETAQFTPHNSASAASALCIQTPALPTSWGRLRAVYR